MTEFEKPNQGEYTEIESNQDLVPMEPSAEENENFEPANEPQNIGQWNQNQNPWNNEPYPNGPQNNGQWNPNQNPWNNEPYPNGPQNNGQWNPNQNPWNNGQYPNGPQNNGPHQNGPQNNGPWNPNQGPQSQDPWDQRPYQNPYNPYSQKPKKNGYATSALISGIFAVLMLCCFTFTSSIIMGVGAISIAIISKRDEPFTKSAIAAIVLGIIAIIGGFAEFGYSLWLSDLLQDPANVAMFNQIFEQFQQEMGGQIGTLGQ